MMKLAMLRNSFLDARIVYRAGLSLILAALVCALAAPTFGQDPAGASPEKIEAVVIDVRGSVKQAPAGVSPTDKGWTEVKLNDKLGAGVQIKTSFRSHVTLRFGDLTVVSVRRATLASIDAFRRSQTEDTIRIGLGYGAIRGGSAEGERRTDLVVDTTVATLAKRGTWGWQIKVDPSTLDFEVTLSRSGLIDALDKLRPQSRELRPGEYVNPSNVMNMWVNQDLFDREVRIYAAEGVSYAERLSTASHRTGVTALGPAASTELREFARYDHPEFITQNRPDPAFIMFPPTALPFVIRSEGDFGVRATFRALRGAGRK
jgi:hypothetical protein